MRRIRRTAPDRNGKMVTRPGWDLTPSPTAGRWFYGLCVDRKRTKMYRYRALALAFLPNPEGLPEVNHIDGNPANDDIDNLEWSTRKDNQAHKTRLRLGVENLPRGEAHHRSKLTDATVLAMRRLAPTDRKAALRLGIDAGVTYSAATAALSGRTWTHLPLHP